MSGAIPLLPLYVSIKRLSGAEIKNEWSSTATSLYVSNGEDRGEFIFYCITRKPQMHSANKIQSFFLIL